MRTIKFTRAWPYSLDGRNVLTTQPGDILTLPNELADAAMAYGGQSELALDPTTLETKEGPQSPVPPTVVPPTRHDLDDGEPTAHVHSDPTTSLDDPLPTDDIEDDTIHEPGNDDKTVPEAVAPKKATRAEKRAARKAK